MDEPKSESSIDSVSQIVVLDNGVVKLREISKGDDNEKSKCESGDTVCITYREVTEDGSAIGPTETRSLPPDPFSVVIGAPNVPHELTIALQAMKSGEEALFSFPREANRSERHYARIQLLEIVRTSKTRSSEKSSDDSNTMAERVAAFDGLKDATTLKEQGNARMKAGDVSGARYRYMKALQFLELPPPPGITLEQKEQRQALTVTLHSNAAQACLELKLYDDAIQQARAAIAIDPTHEKALYRYAVALRASGKVSEALEEAQLLISTYPHNIQGQTLVRELQTTLESRITSNSSGPSALDSSALRKAMMSGELYDDKPAAKPELQSTSIFSQLSTFVTDWCCCKRRKSQYDATLMKEE